MYIIGADGKENTQLSDGTMDYFKGDMATTSSGASIYKIGCYMYKKTVKNEDGTSSTYFGVKNFNPNVEKNIVMEARMESGSTLYAPSSSPSDVFVFEKTTNGTNITYSIYRII